MSCELEIKTVVRTSVSLEERFILWREVYSVLAYADLSKAE